MFKKSSKAIAVLLIAASFQSCTTQKLSFKANKPLVGIWQNVKEPASFITYTEDGHFYNSYKEGDNQVITHSGNYKIIGNDAYLLDITYELPNRKYALKDRQYINHYVFGKDLKSVKLSGVVSGKSGSDTLKWEENMVKVKSL
ncbi:hypothetical protein OQX63_08695 [Pedobacter sp. PF22-3]|jgi:hypothetical protein|uniref:hypothetical protein n=1 Tax=Pedobacter sp. PF22-3 TaxID=2994467 RepID=UPI0022472E00|nr:hypothetical protein [Pedobacter sp. PF22-3]MCX2493544.1 hypothetical protein [Pedobacter sp. PF22-3]